VRQTINRLPASYAHILELRYGDDLTVPEIARLLQLSESAAESRLVRAKQAFRDTWVGDGGEGDAAPALQPEERT
jgi:DNA-directed RNA polymerase specialized sigma24 family protein